MATIAVFIALGGSTVALTKINGSQIKNRSVAGKKLKKHSLTSTEVESAAFSLNTRGLHLIDPGPTAARPTGKERATITPGGLVKLSVGETATLISDDPFTVTASCEDLGGGSYQATLAAASSAPGTRDSSGGTYEPGVPQLFFSESGTSPVYQGAINTNTLADPAGDVLTFGGPSLGVHVFDADCVATVYAVG